MEREARELAERERLEQAEKQRAAEEQARKEKEANKEAAAKKAAEEKARLKQKAKQGFALHQYKYGKYLLDQNQEQKGIQWITRAAEQGLCVAQAKLVYHFKFIKGDFAIYWYKFVAECSHAKNLSGTCWDIDREGVPAPYHEEPAKYFEGLPNSLGAPELCLLAQTYEAAQSIANAIYLYQEAAKQGHAESQYYLAECYSKENSGVKDLHKAIELYTASAGQGHPDAQYALARHYEEAKDWKQAEYFYSSAAKLGQMNAQKKLCCWCVKVDGQQVDWAKAAQLYTLANNDFPHALYLLGNWHKETFDKYGGNHHHLSAKDCFKLAAKDGSQAAQSYIFRCIEQMEISINEAIKARCVCLDINLAICIVKAKKIGRNSKKEALILLSDLIGTDKDRAFVLYSLGELFYSEGEKSRDQETLQKAVEYLTKALRYSCLARAQHLLGVCYLEGHGVDASDSVAAFYFSLAAEQGHTPTCRLLESRPGLSEIVQTY